ncbi:MAG: magnesium/cobalt transporter CorA [Desulfovibrio sp.]
MARFLKKRDGKRGLPPGSLIFIGKQKTEEPRIRIVDYDTNVLRDELVTSPSVLAGCKESHTTSWINIEGLHEAGLVNSVGTTFEISPLILEDILNTGQRPKLEDDTKEIFITLKILFLSDDKESVHAEQFSAILQNKCLLTFLERSVDVFKPVQDRIQKHTGRIRKLGPDYLVYTLLDCVFENYLKVIEVLGERIEEIEDEVLDDPTSELLEEIIVYRREIAYVKKSIRPAREIAYKLARIDSDLVSQEIKPFLRDLSDMAELAYDSVEIYHDMLTDHLNSYNMVVTNKLNDTMRFLTIFATIFIPLSFLAGVYGMNFEVMPELHLKYGYFILLGVMAAVALVMLYYFKRKKWL